jgi:PAS domain S-box-containing protein
MKNRMPRLLGEFPDGVVIVDAQGRILQANAQAISLFGCSEGELNGTPIQALFPDQPAPFAGGCSRRRNQAGRCHHLVGNRGNSSRFRAAVAVMPMEMGNGAAVISIRDITEAQETQFVLERGLELLNTVISSW